MWPFEKNLKTGYISLPVPHFPIVFELKFYFPISKFYPKIKNLFKNGKKQKKKATSPQIIKMHQFGYLNKKHKITTIFKNGIISFPFEVYCNDETQCRKSG